MLITADRLRLPAKMGAGNSKDSYILSRIDELRILAEEYQPHVIGINEAKLNDLILDNELKFMDIRLS